MSESATRTGTHDDSLGDGRAVMVPNLPYLFVVLEADRPGAGGARYSLTDTDEVLIGRGDERTAKRAFGGGRQQLHLGVPGRAMSSRHARLFRDKGAWFLEDTRSKNGTFVNQQRIETVALQDGDWIEAGHSFFRFRAALPSPDGPTDLDSRHLRKLDGLATLVPSGLAALQSLERVAASTLSVLLLGETGTGKEVLARAIHDVSRRTGPFVAINCGALSPSLVEGQLFGHVKGAFSGATREEEGAFRAAEGGTLLLDEIGDLPKSAQPALLRVLQERQVTPVGSAKARDVDVRVIAATHQPISDLTQSGDFRLDVLARLSGFIHPLVALRERREDLGLLVASLLGKLGREAVFSMAAGWELVRHSFSANVRELEQALARATLLAEQGRVTPRELQLSSAVPQPSSAPTRTSEHDARAELIAHLERHEGSVADVARALGRSRMQVYRWLEKYQIDPKGFRR